VRPAANFRISRILRYPLCTGRDPIPPDCTQPDGMLKDERSRRERLSLARMDRMNDAKNDNADTQRDRPIL
jgi:hypothetical protein